MKIRRHSLVKVHIVYFLFHFQVLWSITDLLGLKLNKRDTKRLMAVWCIAAFAAAQQQDKLYATKQENNIRATVNGHEYFIL